MLSYEDNRSTHDKIEVLINIFYINNTLSYEDIDESHLITKEYYIKKMFNFDQEEELEPRVIKYDSLSLIHKGSVMILIWREGVDIPLASSPLSPSPPIHIQLLTLYRGSNSLCLPLGVAQKRT
jgi:hypothetical protein